MRVGLHYRALAVQHKADIVWFWVGPHAEYNRPYNWGQDVAADLPRHMALANDVVLVFHFLMPSWNFMLAWLPLQKGLLSEAPHRHNVTRLRVS